MKIQGQKKTSNSSDNVHRKTNGKGNMRSKSTIMRLNMYRNGAPIRDKSGKIVGGNLVMNNRAGGKELPTVARIAPDRRWFGNTRSVSQEELDKFREDMSVKQADPFSVVLRRKKIPMALLQDNAEKTASMNLTETESFQSTFGSKSTRKRPKFSEDSSDYSSLLSSIEERTKKYDENPQMDSNVEVSSDDIFAKKDDLFSKGQSKRIWSELYKVLDCSDVVIEVVDARNVPGTRSIHIENHIKKKNTHKHLIIVLNKCDLVPAWVTKKWIKILSKDFPTLAFHASITNSFGKGALISLLRQFGKLHSDKRQISVGVIGYPNTGKSSIINTLMGTKCCKAAPVPGETKVWQYITLMKRIFLIDCPGVVYDVGDDEVETVLKGVVRAERLETPSDFIQPILDRVKKDYITRQYGIKSWDDAPDFLTQLAQKQGKLLKGGEVDVESISINIINDWQRGRLPYFVAPPRAEGEEDDEDETKALESLKMLNKQAIGAAVDEEIDEDDEDLQVGNDDSENEEGEEGTSSSFKYDEEDDEEEEERENGLEEEEEEDGESEEEENDNNNDDAAWNDL